jgi:hypothetical protein
MGKQTVRKLYTVVPDGMYANLVGLLKFDGFRFSQLMRILLNAYVNDHEEVVKYVHRRQEEMKKSYRKHIRAQRAEIRRTEEKFNPSLTKQELENIFDMIEGEYEKEEDF